MRFFLRSAHVFLRHTRVSGFSFFSAAQRCCSVARAIPHRTARFCCVRACERHNMAFATSSQFSRGSVVLLQHAVVN